MTNNNIRDFFVTDKRFEIFTKLIQDGEWYTSKLARHTNTSKPHARGIVMDLQDFELLEVDDEANGKRLVRLTDKGEELAREFDRFERVIKEVEQK